MLDPCGKLLKKRLRPWFASNRQADRLVFKDVFPPRGQARGDFRRSLRAVVQYRDNRNETAHDYGAGFAEATLKLLPHFIADAEALADAIEETR